MQLSKDDCAGFCESESDSSSSDAEYCSFDAFLCLEVLDSLKSNLMRSLPVNANGFNFLLVEEVFDFVKDELMMPEDEYLDIVFHNFFDVLLHSIDFGLPSQAVALDEGLALVAVLNHLQLVGVAETRQYHVDLFGVLAVGVYHDLLA